MDGRSTDISRLRAKSDMSTTRSTRPLELLTMLSANLVGRYLAVIRRDRRSPSASRSQAPLERSTLGVLVSAGGRGGDLISIMPLWPCVIRGQGASEKR